MRLYRAICAWLEASAAAMSEEQEPQPEGNNFTQAEHAHSYSTEPELHIRSNHEPAYDDEDKGRRLRPIGFTRR